jgi:catechol 2,3-dioxygenase-like lactoylglutathione lyase family enzyme
MSRSRLPVRNATCDWTCARRSRIPKDSSRRQATPESKNKTEPTSKGQPTAQFPAPKEGIAITHFIVSSDVERSRRFYTEVLGGTAVLEGELSIVALANGWVTISTGGGPTPDKPDVTLVPPSDTRHASSFLNIRVSDIHAVYEQWRSRGAEFLTPPTDRGVEIRCYMRDPDGHLIEVGQLVGPPAA